MLSHHYAVKLEDSMRRWRVVTSRRYYVVEVAYAVSRNVVYTTVREAMPVSYEGLGTCGELVLKTYGEDVINSARAMDL